MAVRPSAILPFLKGTRPYALYVLCVLMLVFTLNQMDRFLLGVTGGVIVKDLRFGDYSCSPNSSSGTCNSSCAEQKTKRECEGGVDNCVWDHTPLGLKYELLAGPLFTFFFTLATIPVGVLASNRWVNRRVVLAVSLALWSGTTLATSFTHHYWQLLLTRLGLGLFEAVCTPFASCIISDYFQEKYRGTALGFYNWGIYLGYSAAFGFDFVLSAPGLDWRWVFIIGSLPGFAVALLMLLTVREPARNHPDQSQVVPAQGKSFFKKLLRAYLQPALLVLCVAGGVRLGAGIVWAYNVKAYFAQLYCQTVNVGEYLSWVPVVGGTMGALIGGYLSDRLARFGGYKGRMWVLIFSQILAAPFLVGTVYLDPIPWAFLSLIPAYVVGEAWLGICLTVAIELVPIEVSPASISLFIFISNNISSVMPLLLPPLTDYYGLRRAMLVLFPGLYVVSAALFSVSLFLLIVRDMCREKQGGEVKLKSPRRARQASRERRRRRRKMHSRSRHSERSPLLQDDTDRRNYGVQRGPDSSSGSSASDCGDFEEIDEREQDEAKKALSASPSSNPMSAAVAGPGGEGRGAVGREGTGRGRGRGYGSLDSGGSASVDVLNARGSGGGVSGQGPAPVVGSVSNWSMLSPSTDEDKRWLAVSQEGI